MGRADGEPVPPEHAPSRRNTRRFPVGEMWGALWDTVWFRFQGEVPREWKGCEVVALVRLTRSWPRGLRRGGRDLSESDASSAPLNLNRREVEIAAKAKGGRALLSSSSRPLPTAGPNPTWRHSGLNLPDYNGKPLFRLEQAELACQKSGSFRFLLSISSSPRKRWRRLPENSQRRAELRYALNESVNEFDHDDPSSIKRAAGALRGVMRRRNGETVHTVSAVGHAHIDTAWLWPLRETIRKMRPHVFHRARITWKSIPDMSSSARRRNNTRG